MKNKFNFVQLNNIDKIFFKTSQFSGQSTPGYIDWAMQSATGKTNQPFQRPGQEYLNTPQQGFGTQRPEYIPPSFQKIDQLRKDEAEALKNLEEYDNLSKTIIIERLFENNVYAVKVEIERLENVNPGNEIIDFENKTVKVSEYLARLKRQAIILARKSEQEADNYDDLLNSELMSGAGGTQRIEINPSQEYYEWEDPRNLAALERLIRQRQENLEDIDSYLFDLVTGGEFTPFAQNLAHTNAKFVKVADDNIKQADEEIEEYYNELYDESEGSPNYGTALEHPQENRDKLTENIKKHSRSKSVFRFRKK